MTSIYPSKALGPNPMVKYPLIPISYGNSYVGLFDSEKAIQSTKRLFEAYGVKLQPKGAVKGEGFAFEADGWDAERKIGFRLIRPGEQPRDTQEAKPTAEPEKALEAGEMEPLGKAMTAGQLKMFVAETHGFPNMDGDLYTPMEYYLQSVIDYLNWALGGAEIDKEKIFGRVPKGRQR
ncbi:MAG: hypothetical protein HY293_18245 [Planctomycetes bacterium]|nr:hypothetical protein [Planctomycetota bacterium]